MQGVFEPVYNRFSTTTTCPNDQLLQNSRYPRSLWPAPAGCLSGWKAISGIPGTNWQVPQDAPNRTTTTPSQGLRWPCGTPVDDPTAAGRRGMTGHGLAGYTGWCLSTTEADSFAVWPTLGNNVHGEPKKINFIFEKSAVAFPAGLPMGFAWYIKVWAPVGSPEGQRSDISTPHAHGMRLWAGGALAWGGPPRTAGPGASPAKRPIRGSPTAPNHAGAPRLGPKPGLARGQAARARLASASKTRLR